MTLISMMFIIELCTDAKVGPATKMGMGGRITQKSCNSKILTRKSQIEFFLPSFSSKVDIHFILSTDEGALVRGAKKLGFSFNVRTPTSVIINAVRMH